MAVSDYTPTIGIECHIQLKTNTKLFVGVDNNAREAAPNSLTSPLCFGLPGTLPVLNEEAIDLALRAGIALNADIPLFSKFDRKHYFYPDLPLGYQITQFDEPIVGKGYLDVPIDGKIVRVGITRAHMEADAGKSTHPSGANYSLVDLNRAGTPLLEIVSEPDMHSAQEARAFVKELYFTIKYSGASDVDLYYGNMRFDINVSLAKSGSDKLGTRAEIKNLNSFKSVERAALYEIKRQAELLDKGEAIVQETRGWSDDKNKTFSQRSKEDAHDYRYFPDPDLPPIVLDDERIAAVRKEMPKLPAEIRTILVGAGVALEKIDTLLENEEYIRVILLAIDEDVQDKALKRMVNWLTVEVQTFETSEKLTFTHLLELSDLVETGSLSATAAKDVLKEVAVNGGSAKDVAEKMNLIQVSDSGALEGFVEQVIKDNPQAVSDVQNGEMKVVGFLVGQVMKLSKGQANPALVQPMIIEKIKQL